MKKQVSPLGGPAKDILRGPRLGLAMEGSPPARAPFAPSFLQPPRGTRTAAEEGADLVVGDLERKLAPEPPSRSPMNAREIPMPPTKAAGMEVVPPFGRPVEPLP